MMLSSEYLSSVNFLANSSISKFRSQLFPSAPPTSSSLPVHPGDRDLQAGRERYPEQVRHLRVGHPEQGIVDGDDAPDDGDEHDEDIERREQVALQSELEGRVGGVRDQVEEERNGDDSWDRASQRLHEHRAEGYGDDQVQDGPDRAEYPGGRGPGGLTELCVSGVGRHPSILALIGRSSMRGDGCVTIKRKYCII